jgi:hypothetical protein
MFWISRKLIALGIPPAWYSTVHNRFHRILTAESSKEELCEHAVHSVAFCESLMPPAKRARRASASATVESADTRIDGLLNCVEPGGAAAALLIAAMEWDDTSTFTSEGKPALDFFSRMKPFVMTLGDEDAVVKELFMESLEKPDETALEEVYFLQRSGVLDDEEEANLRAAEPEDRRRLLFLALLADSETPDEDDDDGEHADDGDHGVDEVEHRDADDDDGQDASSDRS